MTALSLEVYISLLVLNRFGDRSFAVAGPRLWNSLPISLRQILASDSLGDIFKNHLFGI